MLKRKLGVTIVRIKMVDRYQATVDEAPNITIAFAAEEDGALIDQVLGMLMHDVYNKSD